MSNRPRYLFRTFSPGSDGANSKSRFDSMAKCNGHPAATLHDFDQPEARNMLKDHVLWTSWRNRNNDLLISFSSSFLFAIQHGIRKINKGRRTQADNCFLMIIDTTKVPNNPFSWTPSLLGEYGLNEATDPYLLHDYHEAEYLAQFELMLPEEASAVASFETLYDKGSLFEAIPQLARDDHGLVRTLSRIRASFVGTKHPISKDEVEAARNLALCFGGEWTCPIIAWILSLEERSENDSVLHIEFQDSYHGPLMPPFWGLDDISDPPSNLKELREWVKIVRAIHQIRDIPLEGTDKDLSDMLSGMRI